MRSHPSNTDVQHNGSWALIYITVNNADNQVFAAKAGGIELVINAMRVHASNTDVQHYGCWALGSITRSADNRVLAANAGGIEAVISGMRNHASNADVQYFGCWALLHIGWSSPVIQQAIQAAGGADAARTAARAFPAHADIQENATDLLSRLPAC